MLLHLYSGLSVLKIFSGFLGKKSRIWISDFELHVDCFIFISNYFYYLKAILICFKIKLCNSEYFLVADPQIKFYLIILKSANLRQFFDRIFPESNLGSFLVVNLQRVFTIAVSCQLRHHFRFSFPFIPLNPFKKTTTSIKCFKKRGNPLLWSQQVCLFGRYVGASRC